MSTSLYAISNITLSKKVNVEFLNAKIQELKALNWKFINSLFINENGEETSIQNNEDWHYEVINEDGFLEVDFTGSFCFTITLMPNIAFVSTIYKYRMLYELNEHQDILENFRVNLYNLITIFGGTEVIFLADNATNKLNNYLELMAWENVPYNDIKNKMINEFGQPIIDYSLLDYSKLSYSNINEFVLDDLSNVLPITLFKVGTEGGAISIYKSKKENTNSFYYFFKVNEGIYESDSGGIGLPRIEYEEFDTFTSAYKKCKEKYNYLLQLYPVYVDREIHEFIKTELEKESLSSSSLDNWERKLKN
ncbi:hypothetical protein C8N26_1229 [Tenacibaculum lutimaris]|uniref:Uncharacterized protein n=1 Tax=Tenacibaculum lutimaris TaxID=285258 RepID=A0A420E3T6_9FLAO|nr:hypothetical protein [Tenacibaculum lutimaris]RKF04557.1 hypothetical protein C8N26_1229 [Tenacibaculum lutimaris]